MNLHASLSIHEMLGIGIVWFVQTLFSFGLPRASIQVSVVMLGLTETAQYAGSTSGSKDSKSMFLPPAATATTAAPIPA